MLHGVGGPDDPLSGVSRRQSCEPEKLHRSLPALLRRHRHLPCLTPELANLGKSRPRPHRGLQTQPPMVHLQNRHPGLLARCLGSPRSRLAGIPTVSAVAEWYGSLPDEFFYQLKGMPPLLILHGQHDDNIPVSNAQQLIQLCRMKNFPCESDIYPNRPTDSCRPTSMMLSSARWTSLHAR